MENMTNYRFIFTLIFSLLVNSAFSGDNTECTATLVAPNKYIEITRQHNEFTITERKITAEFIKQIIIDTTLLENLNSKIIERGNESFPKKFNPDSIKILEINSDIISIHYKSNDCSFLDLIIEQINTFLDNKVKKEAQLANNYIDYFVK